MEARLGIPVTVVDRVVSRLVESDVPLHRLEIEVAARKILQEESPFGGEGLVQDVVDSLIGLGPLEELLRDPQITDVLVNGPDEIWVERAGSLARVSSCFPNDETVVAAVERVIAPLGLRIDRASPMVDARLPDGNRLHAVIPPVAVDHPVVAVRRFIPAVTNLAALVAGATLTPAQAEFLRRAVVDRLSLVVSGGTGAGKTTLLNVLSAEIPPGERIVTIEDAAELSLNGHVVRLEGRPANAEGAGEINLQQMVRSALRLRPDRIVIGEVRGAEAFDLIAALNTGHRGSMSTVHANNPDDALWRLETLALSGINRVEPVAIRRQLRSALDLVVQIERLARGRVVTHIAAVGQDGCREIEC